MRRIWVVVSVCLAVWVVLGGVLPAAAAGGVAPGGGGDGVVAEQQRWATHRDWLGFSIQYPPGWTVATSGGGVVTVADAEGTSFALVAPLLLNRSTRAEDLLKQVPDGYSDRFPRATLVSSRTVQRQPDTAMGDLSYRGQRGNGRALLLGWVVDRSAMLAAVAAPESRFNDQRPTLVRILQSLRFDGVDWQTWQDPKERAFTVEAPRDWKVDLGLYRFAPTDVRAEWSAWSPDGEIYIGSGDQEIPSYIDPSAFAGSPIGFPVGSWYSPGGTVNIMVRRFQSAKEYAVWYAQNKIARACDDLRIVEQLDRFDLEDAIAPTLAQSNRQTGADLRASIGEVRVACTMNGAPREGSMLVGINWFGGAQLWWVSALHGYLAAPDLVLQARSVHMHMLNSVKANPEWSRMQAAVTATQAATTADTSAAISSSISASYWSQQRTQDDLSRKWSNAMLGQTDVLDPDTGVTWKVASGHNYYWAPAGGTGGPNQIVGTNTADSPDINYSLLLEY